MEVTWYGVYAIGFMSMFHILVLYINTVSYSVSLSKCLGLRQRSLSLSLSLTASVSYVTSTEETETVIDFFLYRHLSYGSTMPAWTSI